MSWRLSPPIETILAKGRDGVPLERDEALQLVRLDLESRETYALMEAANHLSRTTFGDKGEMHFHIGLNVEPCPMDCAFCSLTRRAGLFTEAIEFPEADILAWAREGAAQGADALNLMTTGSYPLSRLLEVGRWLRREVAVPLVANTRDLNHAEAEQLLAAGFVGCYHAVRLGEGTDTPFRPERRILQTILLREVGLQWMTGRTVVGPGAQRRRNGRPDAARPWEGGHLQRGHAADQFPGLAQGTPGHDQRAAHGPAGGGQPTGHGRHGPGPAPTSRTAWSLVAGANLFFPEVGSSPRPRRRTPARRGQSPHRCAALFREMGLEPGPDPTASSPRQHRTRCPCAS